ncbi:MAG TPA: lipoyl(octanoyl) transferase LipB [Thermoanaerobaculia bacterium]|jgi:lipoyl(octanoyl) transferase
MEASLAPDLARAPRLEARWLGRVSYDRGLELQREAAARALSGGDERLLLLEHEPVYTLGRNASRDDVLWKPEQLEALAIAVRESDRGGKVTYHGPGQLVGYPILRLAPGRRDVKRYVHDLEEVLIRTLADFGVAGARSDRRERVTSVWVGNAKIAAIGIHVARWVTTHGFALNVTDEPLARFAGIVPCGITDGGVTSIQRETGEAPAMAEVVGSLRTHFERVFERAVKG